MPSLYLFDCLLVEAFYSVSGYNKSTMSNKLYNLLQSTTPNPKLLSFGAAIVLTAINSNYQQKPTQAEKKKERDNIEVYLMDHIANKPYLNNHSASSAYQYEQQSRKRLHNQSEESDNSSNHNTYIQSRPRGVPRRLRILTVDVPSFKEEAFEKSSICKTPSDIYGKSSPVYVDGVAPSKSINKTLGHNQRVSKEERKPIVQKTLAKQLYYCYDPKHHPQKDALPVIGAEILELSVEDLNPQNIRRAYTVSSKRWKQTTYDPADKYQSDNAIADAEEEDIEEDVENDEHDEHQLVEQNDSDDFEDMDIDIDDPQYERHAPWNQYAWLEEMQLRIHGYMPFGQPIRRAHYISQLLYGRIYHQSIHASGGWLRWLLPFSGSNSTDGIDGEGESELYLNNRENRSMMKKILQPHKPSSNKKVKLNRSSNKPHAVICDGQAMQRVPGSLRYLAKICKEARVPLYILNDHRTWMGSQTHSSLSDAVVDMRKSVSSTIIRNALDLREGHAFERGRALGRIEKEIQWQVKDAAATTRRNLKDARRSLRRHTTKAEDWSSSNEEELIKKLVERKVIKLYKEDNEQNERCTTSFIGVCKYCLNKEAPTEVNNND